MIDKEFLAKTILRITRIIVRKTVAEAADTIAEEIVLLHKQLDQAKEYGNIQDRIIEELRINARERALLQEEKEREETK